MADMKDKTTQSEELTEEQLAEVSGGFQSAEHGAGNFSMGLSAIKGETIDRNGDRDIPILPGPWSWNTIVPK